MKLLFCQQCGDIISPFREDMKPRFCQCSRHAVWWVDSRKGILRVCDTYAHPVLRKHRPAPSEQYAYVLGINNQFLMYPFQHSYESVKEINDACPESYLFKKQGTPFVRFRPGETSDTAWADLPEKAA